MTETILESISDGVFTVDLDWRISYFNAAAERITGVPRTEALGRPCQEVFRSNMCEGTCPLRTTMKMRQDMINRPGFLVRPDGRKVPISVSTALLKDGDGKIYGGAETFRDLSEIEALRGQLGRRDTVWNHSGNPAMQHLLDSIPVYAESRNPVLISGETGAGKEVLARALHGASPWAAGPFVGVNCGALPDSLLESELFGYRKGAFTGADKDKPGRFAAAAGGTLFLDEVAEVSPAMQVKLLRVLQEREYVPLGANHPEKVKARILAGSNRDLGAMVLDGSFRADLYYRLNVLPLHVPALRERREDIVPLARFFLERIARRDGAVVPELANEAIALLEAWSWPGNIRELENAMERAMVLCRSGRIGREHLPPEYGTGMPMTGNQDIRGLRSKVEAGAIMEALRACGGNRSQAARQLGINKATLYRKIASLGIDLAILDACLPPKPENP